MTFEEFNRLSPVQLSALMMSICHSDNWVKKMVAHAPFSHVAEVLQKADQYWQEMQDEDILESMQGHARIGDMSQLQKKFSKAYQEQGQVAMAPDAVINALWQGNKDYEEKFGFIFIVFATGKTAEQMLNLLNARLPNTRTQEIFNAKIEQGKITENRLQKLFLESAI